MNTQTLLEVAVEAAQAAGRHALDNYARRTEVATDLGNDIKLKLDLECQEVIEKTIFSAFPEHSVLGEEGQTMQGDDVPCWIVDPIDGTLNFSHGIPLWCNSVAVRVGGEVVAGAVNVPMLNECYAATVEGDATCNGEVIHTSETVSLDKALIIDGFPTNVKTDERSRAVFENVLYASRRTRLFGTAAVDACFVAAGRADAYVERGIYVWDFAASGLIVRRAGGRTHESTDGFTDGHMAFLASNAVLYDEVMSLSGFVDQPGN